MIKALLARLAGQPYTLVVDLPIDNINRIPNHQVDDSAQGHNGRVWSMVTDLGHTPWSLVVAARIHRLTAVEAQMHGDMKATLFCGNRLNGRAATPITTADGRLMMLR